MSFRSTIFLTDDNIHWYEYCSHIKFDSTNDHIYDAVVLEFKKDDVQIITDDKYDFVIAIKPGSELHKRILKMRD